MSSSWQILLTNCKYEPRIILILLAALRILICFLPQSGYLHPDEFFQSPDILGGHYFKSKVQPVWEFKTNHPIRCMLLPSLLNNLAFRTITLFKSSPSAYALLVAPRLAYALLSFIIDWCLHKLCQYYSSRGLWYLPVSIIFQSSFVCLGCLTRSLSNTPEVVIFALLLVVVCYTIKPRFRILFVTPARRTPVREQVKVSKQLLSTILVGFFLTLGTFNRPTFPAFALIPSIYWVIESFRRNSYKLSLTIRRVLVPLTLSAILTAISIITFDTVYYRGYKTLLTAFHHLSVLDLSKLLEEISHNWVLTPYNFIKYNSDPENLSKYGLHLPYTHVVVNIPLAFNILGLMLYGKIISLMTGSGVYRLMFSTHRVYALMLLTTVTSTIMLSFIPHQEFRFLLPVIVPLVYMFAYNIYSSNKLLSFWLLINLVLLYFYTNIHQAGVTRASMDLDPILKTYSAKGEKYDVTRVNVIALRCYLVPSFMWNIPQDDDRFNFYLQDTFKEFNTSAEVKIGSVINQQRQFPLHDVKLYVMLPTPYEAQLASYLGDRFSIESSYLTRLHNYSPHFSGEDLHMSLNVMKSHGFRSWREAFGFSLLQIDLSGLRQEALLK